MTENYITCPECGEGAFYCNIYRNQLGYCQECELVWLVGHNLFSSWCYESEDDWRRSWERVKGYKSIDSAGQYAPGAPLGEQVTFESFLTK